MTGARNTRLLDVDRLADECAEHTARFFSRVTHDTGYCYELFRRAIVNRNSHAWEKIYHQYQSLVASWVRRHSGLSAAGEDVDYFVNCAFEKMWSAMDADKFSRFDAVADLLGYLHSCVNSVIVDHTRSKEIKTVDLEALAHPRSKDLPSIEKCITDQLEKHRLWQTVLGLTHDEKESTVLQLSYLYDFKPSKIYATFPDQFESVAEIYQIKRNLLNRLRRNPALQQFLNP